MAENGQQTNLGESLFPKPAEKGKKKFCVEHGAREARGKKRSATAEGGKKNPGLLVWLTLPRGKEEGGRCFPTEGREKGNRT